MLHLYQKLTMNKSIVIQSDLWYKINSWLLFYLAFSQVTRSWFYWWKGSKKLFRITQ